VIPIAGAGLAYGLAAALGGSGFIAAFLAGAIFGALVAEQSEQAARLTEELGGLLRGVTFLIFGAVLLGPSLKHVSWQIVLYAVLSLTLVRMLPVAIAMVGSDAKLQTVGFLGWFGPRGLASIVFCRDRGRGSTPDRGRHDPARRISDGRPVGGCTRNHRRATGEALRPLVRGTPAPTPAGDGKRPRSTPSRAREIHPQLVRARSRYRSSGKPAT